MPQRGVGVRQVELVDVLAELPLKAALLPLADQVRFFEPDEPAETRALAEGGPEVDLARVLLGHPEDDVDVALLIGGSRVRERQRLLEEAEVGDVLVRADQRVLPEHIARQDDDRVTDHPLARDVVADDLHLVDDGRLRLVQHPPQVDHRLPVRVGPPRDAGPQAHVDVAAVEVERLYLAGRVVPLLPAEIRDAGARSPEAEHAGVRPALEGIQGFQLLGREPPVADDLEGADAPRFALAHLHD